MSLGLRIKTIRESLGLSIVDFAKKLSVSSRSISYYEKDEKEPTYGFLEQLVLTLNVSPRYIFMGVDEVFMSKNNVTKHYDSETLNFILRHKPTDFFKFSQRTEVCLLNLRIESIRELCLIPEHTFLKKRNVGTHILSEIKGALSNHGLRFGMLPCELKADDKEESHTKLEPFIKYTRIILSDQDGAVSVYKDFVGDLNYPVNNDDTYSKSGHYIDKLPIHYIYNNGNESPEFTVWWNAVFIDDSRREITLKDDFTWDENDFCLIYLIQNGWKLYQANDDTVDKILQAAGLDKEYRAVNNSTGI